MKNIELLELEGKIKNPIMEFLLEHDDYLEKEQIDAILSRGETGLEDLRLILKAYNQHHLKYLEIEDYGNVYCMSTVIAALAFLNDEDIFDEMLKYVYTSPELIDAVWGDDFFEAFPLYYAKFPNKIETLKQAIFDPELIVDTKRILIIGLYSMPTTLNKPELNATIAQVFLDYLQFLLDPQNRETQDNASKDWYNVEDLIEDTIGGYMDCGGDGNHPLIQQAVEEDLISEDIFEIKDLQNWQSLIFPLRDIYKSNEFWKEMEQENTVFNRNLEEKKRKENDLNHLLNVTKQFRKIYDRNDKVSVKYKADGNILKDIKYKKVEDDLISGKCELI